MTATADSHDALAKATLSCRACNAPLHETFVDLGVSPVSNALVGPEQIDAMEPFYPLHAFVCTRCFLVQVGAFHAANEIFTSEYAYFSSYSSTWLEHARAYVAEVYERFGLTPDDLVVEVASSLPFSERKLRVRSVRPKVRRA